MKEDFDDEMANATRYINITISVSADNIPATRAPQGGEYGDGYEKSTKYRENEVEKITLIFYQDNTGINTNSDNAKVVCVKTYEVHPIEPGDLPNTFVHTHKTTEPDGYADTEIYYSTGDQKLEETTLEAGQTYKVLVVANANVDVSVAPGAKIKDIRNLTFPQIYTGTGLGIDASKFVMTSESDATITLTYPTINTEENKAIYYSDCIHIERLAARIDYCTRGADYNLTYGGYEYKKKGPNNEVKDIYVVTKVTPFNLYTEPEYYFKRVQDAWPATPPAFYLGDESTTNWVVDPKTADKTQEGEGANVIYNADVLYENRLNYMHDNPNATNTFSQVMTAVHETSLYYDGSYDNIIIAYPRENTLLPDSYLKYYATGVVFEVDFYKDVNKPNPPQKETRKYYHCLRHQGETLDGPNKNFETKRLDEDHGHKSFAEDKETCYVKGKPHEDDVLVPMRCGIVRNNIYRISVTGFSDEDGTIILSIEEEKWRHVDNPPIYI